MSLPAVFLDRDGVITNDVYYEQWGEWEAPMHVDDVSFCAGAEEALKRITQAGFALFLVSNQAAYAKGKTSLEKLIAVGDFVEARLAESHVTFTETFYSYTHPKGCVPGFSGQSLERKPGTYFLHLARARHGLDFSQSWMIGDRDTDILCGNEAGVKSILVHNEHGLPCSPQVKPYFFVKTLTEAADIIIAESRSTRLSISG